MQCWLVEREYDDKGLVRLVYAPLDGEHRSIQERSANMLKDGVPAARNIPKDRLDPVNDVTTRDRYAAEATRMADRHEPDDRI